ncbi:MAG: hypothetical protein U5K74_07850 [Gemmatimonadaceae bacterium]|nr:hypothetical protein [Gemmatimonadaceae bacterium]
MTVALPLVALLASVLMLLWDVGLAGRLARVAEAPRGWAALTALTGLLLIPAALIRVIGSSLLDGRTVAALGWLWPLVLTMVTWQAVLTLARGLGARAFVAPIMIYDAILATAAWIEYASGSGIALPLWLHAVPTAMAGSIGYVAGPAALWSPLAFAPPLIAPAYRARWAVNASVRGLIALYAVTAIVAFSSELPLSIRAVQSFSRWTLAPLRERPPDTPLLVGVQVLPVLRGTPAPLALRYDIDLADSANVDAIAVTVAPGGATPRALDSLARALEKYRADSTLIVVTLGWDVEEALRVRFAPTAWERDRIQLVDQVVRRLRPDVLVPLEDPNGLGVQIVGTRAPADWQPILTQAAKTAHALRPRTRVLAEIATFDDRDSVLATWATTPASGMDGIGYILQPGFRGGVSLEARMQAADRWRAVRAKQGLRASDEWVLLTAGFPWTQGEEAQDRGIWGVLAWASARPTIGGVIVGDAGDYDTRRGIRGPGGRLRLANTSLRRAIRGLSDGSR